MSGISVVGRNCYGVFLLRGKLLNVREASHKQIMEHAEIQNIKQILGLQYGKVWPLNLWDMGIRWLWLIRDVCHLWTIEFPSVSAFFLTQHHSLQLNRIMMVHIWKAVGKLHPLILAITAEDTFFLGGFLVRFLCADNFERFFWNKTPVIC